MKRSSVYRLRLGRREKKKLLRIKWLIILLALVGVGLVVWLAWIRPMQQGAVIQSFEECVAAGYPIQESYPEVCLTDDGKRFVNPKQDAAHQDALASEQELLPPTDPSQLKLDIDEWSVRLPLTMQTFDLTYAYFDINAEQYILFTYKRLLQKGLCKGDIGLRLTRSFVKHEPPFHAKNPPPIAQLDKYYFYATVAADTKVCYDDKNVEQVALVQQIAGDKTLIQATTTLLAQLKIIEKER